MYNNNKVTKTVFYITTTILALTLPYVHTQSSLQNVPPLTSNVELSPLTPSNFLRPTNTRTEQTSTSTTGFGSRLGISTGSASQQSLQSTQSPADLQQIAHSWRILLEVAKGAQKFGLDIFSLIVNVPAARSKDLMISPFAIWSLLMLLYEGASGKTYQQLHRTLNMYNVPDEALRSVFSKWQKELNINTTTIEVGSLQAIFIGKNTPVTSAYETVIRDYGGILKKVDFGYPYTYEDINRIVSEATRGLIKTTILPQDLYNANLVMLSSLFFKGQWKYPFNASFTRTELFYNERNEPIGNVEMMVQENKFAFTSTVADLNAYVLELPYGIEDRLSMLILLPKRNYTIAEVMRNLQKLGLEPILKNLPPATSAIEDDVEVIMPKFTTSTDLELGAILNLMGVVDAFDPQLADLSRISQQLFVKKCIHTTKIIVDEEGTTAAAVTSAILINKTSPPKFNLNKPFLYLIVEKTTQLLLFAGQVVNPTEIN